MRILFVAPHLPHPTQGGAAIRNWHLMQAASVGGHTVHLITPDIFQAGVDGSPRPLTLPAYRRTFPRRMRDLVLSREPDLAHRLGAHRLQPEIARRCHDDGYDLIQVEGLEMWPSVPATDVPIIYDAHNAEATLQKRMARQAWRDRRFIRAAYSAIQARKLRRYEATIMRRARSTLAVSDADAAQMHALNPHAIVKIVPIGVDTGHYSPHAVSTPAHRTDVVFTGTFDYRANADAAEWFVTQVWPHIRRARPAARCALVGRNPSVKLRAYNGRNGITVTGSVPDDRPCMAAASVYVLPIRFGAGVRVKLLNAMSMGCAIVATPAACEGVAVLDGKEVVMVSSDAPSFAHAVCALLDDPQRRASLECAARACASARYDWSVCTPALLAVYADMEHRNG
ncbi:MAG: glycosyltransferase family 4 protein [Chloroflexota bacterium]|nr:glycosyltransferase family 4 protein [Chloroflexota bacterium]